ncbi:HPP-domain-containing protein [Trichocladium antarcticum]|uniref:HPP-domain-containing protein n=1 Tax=Trichocladium antarcticum TaxID=1450529 RepID=A0AAN6UEI6_9PEZI|nr:HPP-domain-containing protein [Trichocladium antarcticum]
MIHNQPRRGPSRWNFDIDQHVNPVLPPSLLPHLPAPVAHFLGYRTHPAHPLGNLAMIFWAVVGVFSSLVVIGAVAREVPAFQARGVPTIIGSFGAAAVLDFYAIESPLSQPRNAILGQVVSAVTGIGIAKLFALSPHFQSIRWVGASLACACATAIMALTGTVHPPAGATALMAVIDDDVASLGWFLLLPLLTGCGLMLGVALLVNNIQRRFPFYWWSPQETGMYWRGGMEVETEEEVKRTRSHGSAGRRRRDAGKAEPDESGLSSSSGDLELSATLARSVSVEAGREGEIVIRRGRLRIPDGLSLRPEEILSLETLSERL